MAVATQISKSGRGVNGSTFFVGGLNSSDDPMFINDRSYVSAMNVVNRGGVLQTRPGYECLFPLPEGRLQGMRFFRPIKSEPYLVFAVAGAVYVSPAPFTTYSRLSGIQFYEHARHIYWQTVVQTVDQNPDTSLFAVDPKRILVMQDGGYTKAAFWDGYESRHLNPSDNEVPLGGPMCWSGGRLWVARGNRFWASDLEDPLSFTETTYLAEGGSFLAPGDVTAMAEVGFTTPQMVVFTDSSADLVQSGVRDRTTWKETDKFQAPCFTSVGCVAHRSVVSAYGMLWWLSPAGITNFNSAAQAFVSSTLAPQDVEMAYSKGNLSPNVRDVCAATFENYALFSVPSGARGNRHTWVLDKATIDGLGKDPLPSWNSVWTGTYPVEWATGAVGGVMRCWHVSVDRDGTNRLWECFTADRKDNGTPITCAVETKVHVDFGERATGLDLKRFKYAELTFAEIRGAVSASVFWAGPKGRFKKLAEFDFTATEGKLTSGTEISASDTLYGYRPQVRRVRTPDLNLDQVVASDCSSCGTEDNRTDDLDTGFSLLIVWSGRAALRSYRIFADPEQEIAVGEAHASEDGQTKAVRDSLCTSGFDG